MKSWVAVDDCLQNCEGQTKSPFARAALCAMSCKRHHASEDTIVKVKRALVFRLDLWPTPLAPVTRVINYGSPPNRKAMSCSGAQIQAIRPNDGPWEG